MRFRRGLLTAARRRLRAGNLGWCWRRFVSLARLRRDWRRDDGSISSGPLIAHLFVTANCNQHCPRCRLPERRQDPEMTTAEAIGLLHELAAMNVAAVAFTGGEPLLRRDLWTLVSEAKRCGLETMVVTNGLLLGEQLEQLFTAAPATVMVSLDGAEAPVHDASRGCPGAFAATLANLQQLQAGLDRTDTPTELALSAVICRENAAQLGGLLDLAHRLRVARVIFCPQHEYAPGNCHISCWPDGCRPGALLARHPRRRLVDNSDSYLAALDACLAGGAPPDGCTAAYLTLFIDPQLRAFACKADMLAERNGHDVRSGGGSVRDLWFSPAWDARRRACRRCRGCYLTVNRELDSLLR